METRGIELLRMVTSNVTTTAVAAAIGTLPRTVTRWEIGIEAPDAEYRRRLEICYNVPAASWDAPAAGGATPGGPEPVSHAGRVTTDEADSIDLINAQLQRIAGDIDALRANTLGGVNYQEIGRLEKLYTAIVERRAILMGQLKGVEENRLARTETFRGFVRRIVVVLRDHPAARDAVIASLQGDL